MNDPIDEALEAARLTPPADFAARVMAEIASHQKPAHARLPPRTRLAREAAEWLALGGAVVAGLAQLLPLLFGLWTFTNAG